MTAFAEQPECFKAEPRTLQLEARKTLKLNRTLNPPHFLYKEIQYKLK